MQTSTGIIDYYLKCCIEGGFSKITTAGRSPQEKKEFATDYFGKGSYPLPIFI
jgi:hypothetical protein